MKVDAAQYFLTMALCIESDFTFFQPSNYLSMKIFCFNPSRRNSLRYLLFLGICLGTYGLFTGCTDDPATLPENPEHIIGIRNDGEYALVGISCFPDSLIETCDSLPTIDTMVITLADYPDCIFQIAYELYQCQEFGRYNYHLGNYWLVSHNCLAFTSTYNAAVSAGGATLAAFVENFDHDVYLAMKSNLAQLFVPNGTTPCSESYAYFWSYIRTSCFKTCYIQSGTTVSSKKVACGSDCCSERTRVCRDESGILVFQSTYQDGYYPPCSGPNIYSTGTPILCTSETECGYTCPQ